MSKYFLPHDYSRCSNEQCTRKTNCKRFTDRLPFETYWYDLRDEKSCNDFIPYLENEQTKLEI